MLSPLSALLLGSAAIAVAGVLLWRLDRRIVRESICRPLPSASDLPGADDETEEELRRLLLSIGAEVSPEEIAAWNAEDYDEAWMYVREILSGSFAVPIIPRCLRRRKRRATS